MSYPLNQPFEIIKGHRIRVLGRAFVVTDVEVNDEGGTVTLALDGEAVAGGS
jgi:hypothetical protein